MQKLQQAHLGDARVGLSGGQQEEEDCKRQEERTERQVEDECLQPKEDLQGDQANVEGGCDRPCVGDDVTPLRQTMASDKSGLG